MITKITEANDQEYYAPRFAYITEQLAAREDLPSVVIDSVEAYFTNLEFIKQLYTRELNEDGQIVSNAGYLLLVAPADEEYFNIDANARTISIPSAFKKYGVGVYGDHQAEMLVFKIDRYFDYQDLYDTKIVINWNFTPTGSRAPAYEETQSEEALFPNDVLEPGYVTFGFPVTKDMTPSKGTLNLSVTFYELSNNEIKYSLNTQTISVAINDGLTLENPAAIKSHAKELLNRLHNSAYTPAGIEPIVNPIWRTGDIDAESGLYLGLFNEMNFGMNDDGSEPATLNLQAQAYSAGHLGAMNYTWYADEDDISAIGTGLVGAVKALADLPEDWAGERELALQNQAAIVVDQKGNLITLRGNIEALNETASSNPNQGTHKWIAIDIETRANSLEEVSWDGQALGAEDIADSESVGLPANHIIFWAKADVLINETREVVLSADGFDNVTLTFKFVSEEAVTSPSDYILAFTKLGDDQFVENHTYFVKDTLGVIDTVNALNSQAAISALEDGTEVFELGSAFTVYGAGRYQVKAQATKVVSNGSSYVTVNSERVESNVCVIPSAVKPAVALTVESSYTLPANCVIEDARISPDSDLTYTYIAADAAPNITAIVSSVEPGKELGAIALELLASDEIEELTKSDIEASEYSFVKVAAESHEFDMNADNAVEEGEYKVRAINYKNHTYAVSEPSDKIVTAFVAPVINDIDVAYVYNHDGISENIPVVEEGSSVASAPFNFSTVTLSDSYPVYNFIITDKSKNLDDAIVTYIVEEGDIVSNEFVPLTPIPMKDERGNIVKDEKGNIVYTNDDPNDPMWEQFEVVKDSNGKLMFSIGNALPENRDTGYFRIKTVNRYKGTAQTAYTGYFLVSKL